MRSSKTYDTFLALIRLGIGYESCSLSQEIEWSAIKALADAHGLSAIVLDGLASFPFSRLEAYEMPQMLRLQWIGEVMQSYETRYALYEKAIGSLAGFYNQHGYKMMVLKGYACSLVWPNPKHRPCGDIDIYLFGRQKEADKEMEVWFKVSSADVALARHSEQAPSTLALRNVQDSSFRIDNSHHHHSVFKWQGFTVENHYDFMNVHHHKSNAEIEKIFKDLANDDRNFIQIDGEKVYLPSANLNALFLLRHAMAHFAAEQITIRHILDWAFFVKAHKREVDWGWLECLLDEFGMMPMYRIINAICVKDLGFDATLFTNTQCDPVLKKRVLSEILSPEFSSSLPKEMERRVVYKYRRWKGNEWKRRLCFNDSQRSLLWAGIKSHIMKPASI